MQIINGKQLDFCDVLIQPKRSVISSRNDVDIYREIKWKTVTGKDLSFKCIPICAANMSTTGTLEMAKLLAKSGYLCALEKHYPAQSIIQAFKDMEALAACEGIDKHLYTSRVAVSIGVKEPLDVLLEVAKAVNVSIINIDIANGYIPLLANRVKCIRQYFPDAFIIAGNVVTGDITQDLILAGANCVKVGIGSGAACKTRLQTGVGRPQLSAIIECADAAHQLHAYAMSDGGCVVPGDICKAFCAGADFVMLGGMLAGAEEAGGETIEKNGKKFKQYYGMSSKLAQDKYFGGMSKYRSSEGREKLIPCTGKLEDLVNDINGSLRSCCTYIGSHCLKHLPKHASFYEVNHQLNTAFARCEDIQ